MRTTEQVLYDHEHELADFMWDYLEQTRIWKRPLTCEQEMALREFFHHYEKTYLYELRRSEEK